MAQAIFSSNFNTNVITLLSIGTIRVDYYDFTKLFKWGFKLYTNACMASSLPSLGSTTIMLSNAVMHFYTELHCCSSCNLSLAKFLSLSGAYLLMNRFSNYGKLFAVWPCISSLLIHLASLPNISTTAY